MAGAARGDEGAQKGQPVGGDLDVEQPVIASKDLPGVVQLVVHRSPRLWPLGLMVEEIGHLEHNHPPPASVSQGSTYHMHAKKNVTPPRA